MRSKRNQEGYLLIDHTNSPGVSQAFAQAHNLPVGVMGGRMMESALQVCHICGGDIVLGGDRSKMMAYCQRHDRYSCDNCVKTEHETGVPHTTYQQKLEDIYEALVKGQSLKEKKI